MKRPSAACNYRRYPEVGNHKEAATPPNGHRSAPDGICSTATDEAREQLNGIVTFDALATATNSTPSQRRSPDSIRSRDSSFGHQLRRCDDDPIVADDTCKVRIKQMTSKPQIPVLYLPLKVVRVEFHQVGFINPIHVFESQKFGHRHAGMHFLAEGSEASIAPFLPHLKDTRGEHECQ